jgi:Flp pilus assembly protein TadD
VLSWLKRLAARAAARDERGLATAAAAAAEVHAPDGPPDPQDASAWHAYAHALVRARRWDDALAAFHRATEADPLHAGAWVGAGNVAMHLGRPRDAVARYERALRIDGSDRVAQFNLVQALQAEGHLNGALERCRALVAAAPDDARAVALLGLLLARSGDADAAASCYESALDLAPQDAATWSDYGHLLQQSKRNEEAERAYRQALAVDPESTPALNNLGLLMYEQDRLEESEALLLRAAAAPVPPPDVWANLANLRVAQNRIDEALALSDRARAAGLDTPELHFSRAMTLLVAGRLPEGFAEYEHRFGTRIYAGMRRKGQGCLWQGEPLAGRTLLLWAEQGMGDTLQFVRYVPALRARGARVVLEAQAPLQRLLATSLGVEVRPPGSTWEGVDHHCPLMSLPHRFGTTLDDIPWTGPYLRAPDAGTGPWPELDAAGNLKVGLVWAGNPSHLNDANRSVPLSALAPLAGLCRVTFFPLQLGPAAAQREAFCAPGRWVDLTPRIRDFADTAAVLSRLDLLVTVDTSVAHLAGALGCPAWVLVPWAPDWRWMLGREDTPWYPTLRLLRQPAPGAWEPVVREVRDRLAGLAAEDAC